MNPSIKGRDFRSSEVPFSQLQFRLSPAAEAGDIARNLGFLSSRQHQPPQRRGQSPSSVLYVWPSPTTHHPHHQDRGLRA